MTGCSIRPAVPNDDESIAAVHRAAFPTDAEARLVALLTNRGKAIVSLVAEDANQVVGHILFSPAQCGPAVPAGLGAPADVDARRVSDGDHRTTFTGLGLAPVAVVPQFQNRGLGSALVSAGLDECRRLSTAWVVLLGHPAYYPRFGFAPASRWNLTCDYGASDAFQFLALTPAAEAINGGHVSYAPEFGEIFAQ